MLHIYNETDDTSKLNYDLLAKHFNTRLQNNPKMNSFEALYFLCWSSSYKLFRKELEKHFIIESEEVKTNFLCVSKIYWTFNKKPDEIGMQELPNPNVSPDLEKYSYLEKDLKLKTE